MLSRSGCRCGSFLAQFRMGTHPKISFFQPQKLFLDPSGPAAGNVLGVWWGEEIGSVCSKPPPSLFCSLLPLPRPLPAVLGKRFFLSFWLYFSQLGKGFSFPFGFISPSWEKVVIFGLPRGPIPQPPVPEPEGEKREPGPSRAACWERGSCGVWGLSRLQGVLSSGRSIPSPDSLPLSACGHPVCQ